MPKFIITLRIARLEGALDPEAKAVESLLIQRGDPIVPNSLKQWKEILITLDAIDEKRVREFGEIFLKERVNPSLDRGEIASVSLAD